jgi:hypothetical protein
MRRWWLLLLASCTNGDSPPLLSAPAAVAVGSTATGWVSFNRCADGIDGLTCEEIRVPMASAQIDAPEVFALEFDPGGLRYTALAPGSATLTVMADGETYTRDLLSAIPDVVDASLACWVSGVPLWGDAAWTAKAFGTNTEVRASFKLFARTGSPLPTELHHDLGVNPLESSLLAPIQPMPPDYDTALFTTPATSGVGSITSSFDPTVDIPIVVFAPAEVTGLKLADGATTIRLGSTLYFDGSYLMVGNGEPTCTDGFTRTLRALTPTTCQLWDGTQNLTTMTLTGMQAFSLSGLAAGECTVELSLDGTSQAITRTFTVTP